MIQSEKDNAILALQNWLEERQTPQHGPGVILRARLPFTQTSKHDARGDAMNIIFENLTARFVFKIFYLFLENFQFGRLIF